MNVINRYLLSEKSKLFIKNYRLSFLLILYLIVYTVFIFCNNFHVKTVTWITSLSWTFLSLLAAIQCFRASKLGNSVNLKNAWRYFGFAVAAWFIGMLIWGFYELLLNKPNPYPSVADLFFMAFGPLFIVGIVYISKTRNIRFTGLIQTGNIGVLFSTITFICFIILYQSIVQSNESLLFLIAALFHVILHWLAFIFAVYILWFYLFETIHRLIFSIICLALLLHSMADTLYTFELLGNSYGSANYLNIVWMIALFLQYLAATVYINSGKKCAVDAEKNSDLGTRQINIHESFLTAYSLLAIGIVFYFYSDYVVKPMIHVLLLIALLFVVFLLVREFGFRKNESNLLSTINASNQYLEKRVEERTKALEAFTYAVSHDLRAPLRSIGGFSEILVEEQVDSLSPASKDALARIRRNVNHMGELINDLLSLSRVNNMPLNKISVNFSAMAMRIFHGLKDERKSNAVLKLQEGLFLKADKNMIEILLTNLLDNAIKYSQVASQPLVKIGYKKSIDAFYIEDNGIGFDMKYSDKLFEPFCRLVSQKNYEGTGIGLATVKRIVEQHSGEIWAESAGKNGAVFYFRLVKAVGLK